MHIFCVNKHTSHTDVLVDNASKVLLQYCNEFSASVIDSPELASRAEPLRVRTEARAITYTHTHTTTNTHTNK